ncbi:phage integrase N-terminal SAM-like domain-containing protein [bacterium]|nr:phage integrase N-terminal SAM-like domain-containing protein [bacterium]
MMTKLFTRFSEDLQLKGLSQKTSTMLTIVAKQLIKHYQKSPEEISNEERRQYFLYKKNVRQ